MAVTFVDASTGKSEQLPSKLPLNNTSSDSDSSFKTAMSVSSDTAAHMPLHDVVIESIPQEHDATHPFLNTVKVQVEPGTDGSLHSRTSAPSSCETSDDLSLSDRSESQTSDQPFGPQDAPLHIELSPQTDDPSYVTLRLTYLLVTLVIMLANGLQGK